MAAFAEKKEKENRMEDKKIELDSVELWQLLDFVASLARGDYDGDENAGAAAVGFVASHLSEAAFEFRSAAWNGGATSWTS
jgi:hypothetical protein